MLKIIVTKLHLLKKTIKHKKEHIMNKIKQTVTADVANIQ